MGQPPQLVEDPLILVYRDPGTSIVVFRFARPHNFQVSAYGMIIADMERHLSAALGLPVETIRKWVDNERLHPTADFRKLSS